MHILFKGWLQGYSYVNFFKINLVYFVVLTYIKKKIRCFPILVNSKTSAWNDSLHHSENLCLQKYVRDFKTIFWEGSSHHTKNSWFIFLSSRIKHHYLHVNLNLEHQHKTDLVKGWDKSSHIQANHFWINCMVSALRFKFIKIDASTGIFITFYKF